MFDLIIGFIVIAVESLLAISLTYFACRGRTQWVLSSIAAGLVLLLLVNSWFIYGTATFARWLPVSCVIILSNQIPVLFAALSGIVLAMPQEKIRWWRKVFVAVLLLAFGGYVSAKPVIVFSKPPSQSNWKDGVCLQSGMSSCSAACAATLLKSHGIQSSEKEMIDLCLTNKEGTYSLGLYRGLKLKAKPRQVGVFVGNVDQLRELPNRPVIISVGLSLDAASAPEISALYNDKYGWTPGQFHTVVLYGFTQDDRVKIGDPSVGREFWDLRDLEILFDGTGYYLY